VPDTLEDLQEEFQYLLIEEDCTRLRKAVGCPACRHTGYQGRTVIPEVLVVTPEVQRAIARGADYPELTSLVRKGGMRTLWEAGLERVVAGTTSLHELLDNVAAPLVENHGAQSAVDALLNELKTGVSSPPDTPWVPEPSRGDPSGGARSIPLPGRDDRGEQTRVLVVDEHRAGRRALREELEGAGFQVLEAADGEAALAYARRLRPDLVITEIATPRLDAVGLLQALAQDTAPPRVIVCTDQTDEELLAWLRELGAWDVVRRPLDVGLVTRRLHDAAQALRPARVSLGAS
jgi:CheY-like chemotaxis protein